MSTPPPLYVAYIHPLADTAFRVSFPDFPGCVCSGKTLEEALKQGAETLAFYVEQLEEDGTEIPSPRTLDEIRAGGTATEGGGHYISQVPLLPASWFDGRGEVTLALNHIH